MMKTFLSVTALAAVVALSASCESLQSLSNFVRPPSFENVPDHEAELRLVGPTPIAPLGGANIRLWTRVTNPNPFGLTLSSVRGTLRLDQARAATADFPLGLPLAAGVSETIPIDVSVDFRDLPGLGDVVKRAIGREPIAYEFEGTVGVNAGRLGTPEFGPLTIVRGTVR